MMSSTRLLERCSILLGVSLLTLSLDTMAQSIHTVCSGDCDFASIQNAVNAAVSGDTIQLGAETFFENVCVVGPGPGLFVLTIRGLGTDATVVDGLGQNLPVFGINDGRGHCGGSGDATLLLYDMTIQNSAACGILASGPPRCNGFGCPTYSSSVEVWNGLIRDNGCGIANRYGASVAISTTTISGNNNDGIASQGRYSWGIHDSTINGNGGYGIRMEGDGFPVTNSTVSGNGAGVGLFTGGIVVPISQTTIAGNLGPGLLNETTPSSPSYFEVAGSIVANNLTDNCWELSQGHNLSSDSCSDTLPTDLIVTDPQLLPLADNGGPTFTHALAMDSFATDGGGLDCVATDQRGLPRPQDGDGDGVAKCDIGAFELQATGKVCICHYPPGRRSKPEEICVGSKAARAHLERHSDTLGNCPL